MMPKTCIDKLWDLAAAEVQSRESDAGEDADGRGEAVGERTVFLMGKIDITSLHAKNPKDLWKKVYERTFPPENTSEKKEEKDPAKDPQYSEPQIDAMRAQKDQELEEYKKNAAKSWKGLQLDT
ncbi:cytoplasmic dynein 2 light intermediate chain 1-like isoform X2 [Syngnathus scovelli]|uniref:cytoplasmic dynein 2 light intermediate chain 1-like isoform X2 n=1 Tax=Syngnathus scovelli TaxID=161590 RepID=UPI00210F6A68|nr:cytoplasmic dynein 2 light intermediate chain 1-like isoform X2 [Syngnathus scovelli]